MLIEYSEYIVLSIGVVMALIGWALRKEHARIEVMEKELSNLSERIANSVNEISKNNTRDEEWRKAVEANHKRFATVDEQRREDARNIYDKMQTLETKLLEKIQRLAELIAKK